MSPDRGTHAARPGGSGTAAAAWQAPRVRAQRPLPPWSYGPAAVLAVTLLHDAEELLTVRAALSRPPLAPLLQRRGVGTDQAWTAFRALNVVVSCAAAGAVGLGVRTDRPMPVALTAATMLVNVAVPHVPAAVLARGYSPGVVTAVALVLPVAAGHLAAARRQGVLTPAQVRRCLLAGLGLVVLGVPLGLLAADRAPRRAAG